MVKTVQAMASVRTSLGMTFSLGGRFAAQVFSQPSLHGLHQPVADEVDAELTVVNLAMLGAAFGLGEDFQRLVLGANTLVEFFCFGEWHHAVVLAVQDQDRASDLVSHAFER